MSVEPKLDDEMVAQLRQLLELDRATVERILDTFDQTSEQELARLKRACEARDAEELGRAAHRLKGGAANLGGAGVAELCFRLEQHSKSKTWDDVPRQITSLEAELVNFRSAIRDALR